MGAKRLGLGLRVCADRAPEWRHAMTIDLDKLERLEREATPGPWHWKHNDIVQRDEAGKFVADVAGMYYDDDGYPNWGADNAANTELIIALRNAAPGLIAELRSARKRIAELERDDRLGAAVRAAGEGER